MDTASLTDQLARLERRLGRERNARIAAEDLLEQKSLELYDLNRRLEQLVQERTRALEITLDNISQGIVMLDPQQIVTVSNARASELLQTPQAGLGAAISSIVVGLDLSDGEASSHVELPSGQTVEVRCRVVGSDGYVATVTDITAIRAREAALKAATAAAEAANEAKSRFLSTMSHEMRTPLNGIIGSLELLDDEELKMPQKLYVGTALEASEALLSLINDVLDFAKLEAGKHDSTVETFAVADRLKRILSIVEPQALKRNNTLSLHIDPQLPPYLTGDCGSLRQILLNLIGNAVKFTQNGQVVVSAETVQKAEANVFVELAVTDTGPGIAESRIGQLFREFSMLDSSYSRQAGGTGLGLAITKRLVESLGGTLGVTSKVGEGSRFWVRLPFAVATATASHRKEQSLTEAASGSRGLSILLVDDIATNRLVGARILEAAGHEVLTAASGHQAIVELSKSRRFDCVLMDISMPELDGIATTLRIRAGGGLNHSIPIIALTANVLAGDRERFLAAGMDDYLTKPIRRADLEALLRNLRSPGQDAVA